VLRNKARCQFIILIAALLLISLFFPLASSEADGTRVWVFETQGAVKGAPVIGSDGTIYTGSDDGSLYALNPDGTLKWAFETGDPIENSPAVGADGTVYLCSSDKLYALNPDGDLIWTFEVGTVNGAPALSEDGTIYVGGWGKVFALNPDGTEKWACETGDFMNTSPVIGSDGTVYVGSDDGNLYAISGGSARAERQTEPPWVETREAEVDVSGQGATLRGLVNPNGSETTYWFEWGYSTGYGNTTTQITLNASTAFFAVSAYIDEAGAGLDITKTYHYRVVASNANGTTYGGDQSFIASEDSFLGLGSNCFISNITDVPHKASLLVLVLLPAIIFTAFWQLKKKRG